MFTTYSRPLHVKQLFKILSDDRLHTKNIHLKQTQFYSSCNLCRFSKHLECYIRIGFEFN